MNSRKLLAPTFGAMLVVLTLAGCGGAKAEPTARPPERDAAFYERWYDAVLAAYNNEGDVDAQDEFYAQDYVGHRFYDYSTPIYTVGLAAYKKHVENVRSDASDARLTLDGAIYQGDSAAGWWTYQSKYDRVLGCIFSRWEGKKVVEEWSVGVLVPASYDTAVPSGPTVPPGEIPTSTDLDATFHERWNDAVLAAYSEGEVDALDEFYAQDYVGHSPPSPDVVGLAAYKKHVDDVRSSDDPSADVELKIDVMIQQGDFSAGRGTLQFTQSTGEVKTHELCMVVRWEGNKVVEGWSYAVSVIPSVGSSAEANADVLATAQAAAEGGAEGGVEQTSVGLAAQALAELEGTTPERAVLLALEALEHYPYTPEAESALAQAIRDLSAQPLNLSGHTAAVVDAQWSPDGSRIATTSWDRTARVWDAATGEQLLILDHPTRLTYFDWSPDGTRIATSSEDDGRGWVWDVTSGEMLLEIPDLGLIPSWSPDGSRLVGAGWDMIATVHDATTGEILATLGEGDCFLHRPSWSPEGDRIVTACATVPTDIYVDGNTPAFIWDAATGEVLATLDSEDRRTFSVEWSQDGDRIVAGYENGTAKVWDVATGEPLLTFAGHAAWLWDVTWSPDGTQVVSSDSRGVVNVWDAASGDELLSFTTGGNTITAHWSPDGKYVIAGGTDFNPPVVRRVWQSTEELIGYARECCVTRELTDAEREQFGLPPR